MPKWPLVAALLLLTAGGTALVTTQLMQEEPASQSDAGSDEDIAASAEAMAARAEIADDPITPKLAPEGYDVTIISYRSEEHTSELQSLMRISYAVFCLK